MLVAILMIANVPANVNAQGKGKGHAYGAVDKIPVDFSAINGNATSVVLVDEQTNISYTAYSSNGTYQVLEVPKNTTFTVWFYMYNSEQSEINYWLKWDDTQNFVGITLQPGEYRGVGTLNVDLSRNSALGFTRL